MKLKSAILATIALMAFAAAAQAGPSWSISFGSGGCFRRPVCYPQPVCRRSFYPAYCAPVVYYNPVYDTPRVIQVPRPYPVTVYSGNRFRWH